MKNIQVIDGALNCSYDVFAVSESDFKLIFPDNRDIEFIEDFITRVGETQANNILENAWKNKVNKADLVGLHGVLFYELDYKKAFYPTKKSKEMVSEFDTA